MALPWDEYARSVPDDAVNLQSPGGKGPSINWPYYNHLMGLADPGLQNIELNSLNITSPPSTTPPVNGYDWSSNFDGGQYHSPPSTSPEYPWWVNEYQPANLRPLSNAGFGGSDLARRQPGDPHFQNLDDQAYPARLGPGYPISNIQDGSGSPIRADSLQSWWSGDLDRSPWTPDVPLELTPVGNPANPRLRREWERKEGRPWPRDPNTGRNYDVAHKKALADGGTNTVDNIHPMHPDAHVAEHMANGDYYRWGLRPGIARAFGGTVARSLDFLTIVPIITGVLSGRIRTDTMEHYLNDIAGVPSSDDPVEPLEA